VPVHLLLLLLLTKEDGRSIGTLMAQGPVANAGQQGEWGNTSGKRDATILIVFCA